MSFGHHHILFYSYSLEKLLKDSISHTTRVASGYGSRGTGSRRPVYQGGCSGSSTGGVFELHQQQGTAAKSKAMERKEVAVDKVQERDKVVQLISLTDR